MLYYNPEQYSRLEFCSFDKSVGHWILEIIIITTVTGNQSKAGFDIRYDSSRQTNRKFIGRIVHQQLHIN